VAAAVVAAAAAAPADGEIAETGDVTIGGITMTSADCDVILGAVATAEEASQAAVQTKAVRKKWDTSTFFGRLAASGMCSAVRTRTALLEAIRALRGTRAAGNRQALMAGKYQTINLGGAGRDQRRFCVFPGCMCVVRGPWRDHITAHVQAIEATMEQGALKGAGAGGGGEVRIPADLQATCRDLLQQAGGGGDDDSDPDAEAAAAAALALHHAQTDYNALQRFASERLRDDPAIVVAATQDNPYYLSYASERLRDDTEFMAAVVKRDGSMLQYASERLRDDTEFMTVALHQHRGSAISFASKRLKATALFKAVAAQHYAQVKQAREAKEAEAKEVEVAEVAENAAREAGKRAGAANAGPEGARKRPRVEEPARAGGAAAV
jgi:hypothetical protein